MTTASPEAREFRFTDADFDRVRRMIRARAGIALADGKRDMVYSRLARRLRALDLDSFQDYLDRLEATGGDEWQAFTNALTTNLTSFFREAHHFQTLHELLRTRPAGTPIRLWSAAASTGEEPYSIAMTAAEARADAPGSVRILATDIDTEVLAVAERGVYALDRLEKLGRDRLKRHFHRGVGPNAGRCRVSQGLRDMIAFRRLNLLEPKWPVRGPFDAIFCRNVMIYFDKPTQHAILEKMMPLLARDGLFFAGHSESFFHAADLLAPIGRTVYRRAGA